MATSFPAFLLMFYGFFLIAFGLAAVVFIGPKAKTALISGGFSGLLALVISQLENHVSALGMLLSGLLFGVFSWRATKTLFAIFDLIPSSDQTGLKGKGIAFLIISLMAVVSLLVFGALGIS